MNELRSCEQNDSSKIFGDMQNPRAQRHAVVDIIFPHLGLLDFSIITSENTVGGYSNVLRHEFYSFLRDLSSNNVPPDEVFATQIQLQSL